MTLGTHCHFQWFWKKPIVPLGDGVSVVWLFEKSEVLWKLKMF